MVPFASRPGQEAFPGPLLCEPYCFVGGERWKEGRRKPTHSEVIIMTSFFGGSIRNGPVLEPHHRTQGTLLAPRGRQGWATPREKVLEGPHQRGLGMGKVRKKSVLVS